MDRSFVVAGMMKFDVVIINLVKLEARTPAPYAPINLIQLRRIRWVNGFDHCQYGFSFGHPTPTPLSARRASSPEAGCIVRHDTGRVFGNVHHCLALLFGIERIK